MKKYYSRHNKFGNTKQECSLGHSHASKLESAVCGIISLRQKAGELELLQSQDHVYLTKARILYIPDFKCLDKVTGETFYIESKGYEDQKWPIKKRLWKHYGPGRLEIWTGNYRNPKLDEIIVPTGAQEEV